RADLRRVERAIEDVQFIDHAVEAVAERRFGASDLERAGRGYERRGLRFAAHETAVDVEPDRRAVDGHGDVMEAADRQAGAYGRHRVESRVVPLEAELRGAAYVSDVQTVVLGCGGDALRRYDIVSGRAGQAAQRDPRVERHGREVQCIRMRQRDQSAAVEAEALADLAGSERRALHLPDCAAADGVCVAVAG